MEEQERARQIGRVIEAALQGHATKLVKVKGDAAQTAGAQEAAQPRFAVSKEKGCTSCDPGSCPHCGYLFTGERIIIRHVTKGERIISDRTLHYLSHGIARYSTQYVVYRQPVIVDLELEELAEYLDL